MAVLVLGATVSPCGRCACAHLGSLRRSADVCPLAQMASTRITAKPQQAPCAYTITESRPWRWFGTPARVANWIKAGYAAC
jgi:hypothetical protein